MDAEIGCSPDGWRQTMLSDSDLIPGEVWWLAEFAPLPGEIQLPRHLILRIQTDEGEIIRWVQARGGPKSGYGFFCATLSIILSQIRH